MNERKEEYAKLVCLFLAEQLRVKRISLHRAADIAQKVVANLNLIDSEADFLRLIKELSKDFEELFHLEEKIHWTIEANEHKSLDAGVREFAIHMISENPKLALDVMLSASGGKVKLDDLKQKFPQFSQFMEASKPIPAENSAS